MPLTEWHTKFLPPPTKCDNESHCLVLQVIVIWSPLPALKVPNPE